MGKNLDILPEGCPACGALPCDWSENPAKAPSIVLRQRIERLSRALGYFLNDHRFTVSVGGNPDAVDEMLDEAMNIYVVDGSYA